MPAQWQMYLDNIDVLFLFFGLHIKKCFRNFIVRRYQIGNAVVSLIVSIENRDVTLFRAVVLIRRL